MTEATHQLPEANSAEEPSSSTTGARWPLYVLAVLGPPLAMWVATRSIKRAAICAVVSMLTLGIGGIIMAWVAIRRRTPPWTWGTATVGERAVVTVGIAMGTLVVIAFATGDPESEQTAASAITATSTLAAGSPAPASQTATATVARPTATAAAASQGVIGELIRVGDLDLTILGVGTFNAAQYNQFNDENFAVRFRATNARGRENAEYSLSTSAFKVVDASGVVYSGTSCAGCPDALQFGSSSLTRGGSFERSVYFAIPTGTKPASLIYQPLLSSNRITIALP